MTKHREITIPVEIFREENTFIAYSPALKISTYANSMDKAKERFAGLVDIFFDELEAKGTTEEVLTECGWKKISKPVKCWSPPTPIATIDEEVKVPCPA